MTKQRTILLLRIILAIYIVLCLVIAGLVQGTSDTISQKVTPYWHFYENQFKTLLIVLCGFLTYQIMGKQKKMRTANLIGFSLSALAIHVVLPYLTGNPELYFFAMPLPWTTLPLQASIPTSAFVQSHSATLGLDGIRWAIRFFWIYSFLVGLTTILFGRRLHCSHLCLFNGFASEVFDPAIPLIGKKRSPLSGKTLHRLDLLRTVYLSIALFFTFFWLILPSISLKTETINGVKTLELIWYLGANLILAMAFWVCSVGRLYCHLCPLGRVLAVLAKWGGMQIQTKKDLCIGCHACDKACPMSISIMSQVQSGKPVISDLCVGCGHCIDACPKQVLSYETTFLNLLKRRRQH